MIRIVLCDDNPLELQLFREKVETCVSKYFPEESVTIKTFISSVELEYVLEHKDVADIYILDVDMPGLDGFNLAKIIRDRNAGSVIFFVTAHMEMADQGYQVQALRYINKNGNMELLDKAVIAAVQEYQKNQEKYILVSYDRNYYRIALSQILYVQISNRELTIYTRTTEAIRDMRGIKELYNEMQDSRFLFIDRGTFVNADYVKKIEGNDIIMQDGCRLSISRRLLKSVKEAIAAYWSI